MILRALTPLHILLLVAVALLIFGPRRLPELGGAIGKTLTEFRKGITEAKREEAASAAAEGKDAPTTTSASKSG